MIPLKDKIRTRTIPLVTVSLISLNIGVFVYQFTLSNKAVQKIFLSFGAVPYNITHLDNIPGYLGLPAFFTIFSAMFLHGGFFHLGGNMLYLWIFGNNVEDCVGHLKFFFFYLICGFIAALTHILSERNSPIPMIGASGAVSGILGAYLLLYPRANILTLIPIGFFIRILKIPAVIFLGLWILLQFLNGTAVSHASSSGGGVAWLAHIGGFFAGSTLIGFFKKDKVKFFSKKR